MSLRVALFASVVAVCSALTVYNPPNAGVAIDAIEKALANIVNSPHLTKDQLGQAKKVSADVEKVVAELESPAGQKLSKKVRGDKVVSMINELQGLQAQWSKAAQLKVSTQKGDLMKQLKAKEEELAKDKKMLKVINLEKALAEKKLALQKLIDMKNSKQQAASVQETQKEAAAQQEMVANLLNMAKALKDKPANAKAPADKLKTVMTYLEGREHKVSDDMAKLDAGEKNREAELKAITSNKAPVTGKTDAISKSQGIIKMLMKKEHRQYQKTRAGLESELKQLQEATTSIKKGDAAGLTKVMTHMQGEMKSLQAKSHKFLY